MYLSKKSVKGSGFKNSAAGLEIWHQGCYTIAEKN
jgi:hypothetical protein